MVEAFSLLFHFPHPNLLFILMQLPFKWTVNLQSGNPGQYWAGHLPWVVTGMKVLQICFAGKPTTFICLLTYLQAAADNLTDGISKDFQI